MFNSDYPTEESDQEALELYQAAIARHQQVGAWLVRGDCYHKMGIIYLEQGDARNALDCFHRAIVTRQAISEDSTNYEDYLYLGDVQFMKSAIDSARYYYQQAEKLLVAYPNTKKKDKLYNSLGNYYFSLGNYQQAKNYLYKSLQLAESRAEIEAVEEDIIRNNIAIADEKLGNYNESISAFKSLLKNGLYTHAILHNLGVAYGGKKQYDSAIHYLQQAIPLSNGRIKNITLNHLGFAYTQLGNLDAASVYYNASLILNDSLFNDKNVILANAYRGIGDVKASQLALDSALYYYQKSLSAQVFSFDSQDIYSNPTDFAKAISLLYLFETLNQKAAVFERCTKGITTERSQPLPHYLPTGHPRGAAYSENLRQRRGQAVFGQ